MHAQLPNLIPANTVCFFHINEFFFLFIEQFYLLRKTRRCNFFIVCLFGAPHSTSNENDHNNIIIIDESLRSVTPRQELGTYLGFTVATDH